MLGAADKEDESECWGEGCRSGEPGVERGEAVAGTPFGVGLRLTVVVVLLLLGMLVEAAESLGSCFVLEGTGGRPPLARPLRMVRVS